jgi:hypothetical protein
MRKHTNEIRRNLWPRRKARRAKRGRKERRVRRSSSKSIPLL